MSLFTYPRPWRTSENNGIISLVAANGNQITEIYPAQVLGQIPPRNVRLGLALLIVQSVNAEELDETVLQPPGQPI